MRVTYNDSIGVMVTGAVLVAPGSVTHNFNTNQRVVGLQARLMCVHLCVHILVCCCACGQMRVVGLQVGVVVEPTAVWARCRGIPFSWSVAP